MGKPAVCVRPAPGPTGAIPRAAQGRHGRRTIPHHERTRSVARRHADRGTALARAKPSSTSWARASSPPCRRRRCRRCTGWPAATRWPRNSTWATGCKATRRWRCWLATRCQPPVGRTRASVYSGHQFGVWAGQLGDGRALLLGEIDSPAGVQEVQLKGSGLTPYSRMGDGRAVLRSSIREFLCSEAMHALGIPTTRALAGRRLARAGAARDDRDRAAVVTRVAPSFLRFGHFEHFAHSAQDPALLRRLVDFTIDTHYHRCPRRHSTRGRAAGGGGPPYRAAAGRLAGGGLLPRRDEHRQPVDPGPHDRLWTVRLPGRLRPRPCLQPFRPPGPLRLCAPAERGVLEPPCAGAGAAAAGRW